MLIIDTGGKTKKLASDSFPHSGGQVISVSGTHGPNLWTIIHHMFHLYVNDKILLPNISKYYFLLCNIGCARIDKLDLCTQWILANHNNQYHGKSRHLQARCYLILFAQNFGRKCGRMLLLMQSCSSKSVSTMQKTGLTNYSSSWPGLVRSGKGFHLGCDHKQASCVLH